MTNRLIILGSTGSIGKQALEVCENLGIQIAGLSANNNISVLEEQARKFKPEFVSVIDSEKGKTLKTRLSDTSTKVILGPESMSELVTLVEADTILTSVVGIAGLIPTFKAIESGKNVALANKETLVTAGRLVMEAARRKNVNILPVDSEHSAIFQCLSGNRSQDIDRLILTASGGPFRGFTTGELKKVTLEQALKHPNWSMGNKITIDSATLMNKGLEVIEAQWLFNMELSKIEVLIHPQSIIHSMVSYIDGSIIAQLGVPDMRIPIQLALTWPERKTNGFGRVNFSEIKPLTFEKPDMEAFPCLKLALRAASAGGSMPAVMNAANEIAVSLFLDGKISFTNIAELIENVMNNHKLHTTPAIDDIIEADIWGRNETIRLFKRIIYGV